MTACAGQATTIPTSTGRVTITNWSGLDAPDVVAAADIVAELEREQPAAETGKNASWTLEDRCGRLWTVEAAPYYPGVWHDLAAALAAMRRPEPVRAAAPPPPDLSDAVDRALAVGRQRALGKTHTEECRNAEGALVCGGGRVREAPPPDEEPGR